MKVVGGPHDGLNVVVGEHCSHIQLHTLTPAPWKYGDPLPRLYGTVTWTLYTVRSLGKPDDCYEFLAPADWSDMQALRHQFGK